MRKLVLAAAIAAAISPAAMATHVHCQSGVCGGEQPNTGGTGEAGERGTTGNASPITVTSNGGVGGAGGSGAAWGGSSTSSADNGQNQDQYAQGGSVILEGSTDNSTYTSTSKYEIPRAPVHSAIAPDLTPTSPCLVPYSGAVQTAVFGVSGGGFKLDEECNRRMNQQQKMDVALRLKHHGMDELARRVMIDLDVTTEVLAKDGRVVFKGRIIDLENLPQWEEALGKIPNSAKYGGEAIESKEAAKAPFIDTRDTN